MTVLECTLTCVCGEEYDSCYKGERDRHYWCWNRNSQVHPEPPDPVVTD